MFKLPIILNCCVDPGHNLLTVDKHLRPGHCLDVSRPNFSKSSPGFFSSSLIGMMHGEDFVAETETYDEKVRAQVRTRDHQQ